MEAIGLAFGGKIPDSSFSASSHYGQIHKPSRGRLNGNTRGWVPRTKSDPADYLQINLLYEYVICTVATQGGRGLNEWTTNYKIRLSVDGTTMVTYQENNVDRVSLYISRVKTCTYQTSKKYVGPRTLFLFCVKRRETKEVRAW